MGLFCCRLKASKAESVFCFCGEIFLLLLLVYLFVCFLSSRRCFEFLELLLQEWHTSSLERWGTCSEYTLVFLPLFDFHDFFFFFFLHKNTNTNSPIISQNQQIQQQPVSVSKALHATLSWNVTPAGSEEASAGLCLPPEASLCFRPAASCRRQGETRADSAVTGERSCSHRSVRHCVRH